MTKIIFFGTEKFAAGILEALIKNAEFKIELIITQPDRPVGRKQELQKTPVKLIAEKYNLKIDQPEKLKNYIYPENIDLNIVCEYGLIIPKNIIESPKFGSVNVHPSLLPKYRGASPIQSVLINGETKTGVSIMLMDEKMDHGPILSQKTLEISPTDVYTSLAEKLLKMAILELTDVIPKLINGKIIPETQDDEKATFCTLFTKENGRIEWNKSAESIYNLARGLEIWPGIWTTYQDKKIKLVEIKPQKIDETLTPGKILVKNKKVYIGCGCDVLELITIQPEGKKPMPAISWINGLQNKEKILLV